MRLYNLSVNLTKTVWDRSAIFHRIVGESVWLLRCNRRRCFFSPWPSIWISNNEFGNISKVNMIFSQTMTDMVQVITDTKWEGHLWVFEWHIWPLPILKVRELVMHISSMNIMIMVTYGVKITNCIKMHVHAKNWLQRVTRTCRALKCTH